MQTQHSTIAVPTPLAIGLGPHVWQPTVQEVVPPGTLRGAIYDRASEPGGYVHAQQTHYKTAEDACRLHGIAIVMYRYEDKKGGKLNRRGYQDICQAAALRLIDVVVVDTMARLGRRGPDRLKKLEEFDRLGVKVLVASKQRFDEPGIIRYVEAWQDEEYLREQARKTVATMPHAIKAGKHPGPNPIGYRRVYPDLTVYDAKPQSILVKDAEYGPLVTRCFEQFGAGRSILSIVHEINSGALRNPKSPDGRWTCGTVRAMLRRRVYLGVVEWGRTHPGQWGRHDGLVEKEKAHEALVSPDLWAKVQARLDGRKGPRRMNQRGHQTYLLDGVLVCRGCGSRVYTAFSTDRYGRCRQYVCADRHRGLSECREPSVSVRLADEAVLAQVVRLKGIAWAPEAFDAAVQRDPYEADRRRLRSLVSADENALKDNATAFRMAGDFGPEVAAAFRRDAEEIKQRLRHHQDELAALPEWHADTVKAKEVHDLLMQSDIPAFVDGARARGDIEVLRDIVVQTVSAARIIARGSRTGTGRQATWAKAEVEWTAEVQLLLDAGLLTLGEDASTPERTTPQDLAAERARRYRARKRAAAQHEG